MFKKNLSQTTIGIFSNAYFFFDGKEYYTDENIILFCLKITSPVKKILIFAPVISENPKNKNCLYKIVCPKAEIIPIPYYSGSNISLLKTWHKTIPSLFKILKLRREEIDMVWQANCPNPLNIVFNFFCLRAHIPMFFFIRQENEQYLKYRYHGPGKYLSIAIAILVDMLNRRLFKKYPVFVSGEKLYIEYKRKDNLVYSVRDNIFNDDAVISPLDVENKKNTDKLNIIAVGRLEKEKGFIYLLRAMQLLINEYNVKACLTLIGSGREEKNLRDYVNNNGLERYIYFAGFVKHGEEFFSYFKNADIMIQPSLSEGSPKTIFEAMAKGIPVIVTGVGSMPYVVKHGINGLVVNPCSPREISDAILNYKQNQHLLKQFAIHNLDYVRQFTFDNQKEIILNELNRYFYDNSNPTAGPLIKHLFVSVIMPCRNEAGYIKDSLGSLLETDYPEDKLEIIVVDGQSEDGTREILEKISGENHIVKIMPNSARSIPAAMNIGIKKSQGEIIVRVDAHSKYPPDYIDECVKALRENSDAWCVGGPCYTTPHKDTLTAKIIAFVISSRFGVGGSCFRIKKEPMYVEAVPYGVFRKNTFDKIGLYDERLIRNEDNELWARLIKNGGKIFMTPEIKNIYYPKTTLREFLSHAINAGLWNAFTKRLAPPVLKTRHFIPLLFFLGVILCLGMALAGIPGRGILVIAGAVPIFLYFFLAFIFSCKICIKNRLGIAGIFLTMAVFFLYHFSYGYGIFKGWVFIITGKWKKLVPQIQN